MNVAEIRSAVMDDLADILDTSPGRVAAPHIRILTVGDKTMNDPLDDLFVFEEGELAALETRQLGDPGGTQWIVPVQDVQERTVVNYQIGAGSESAAKSILTTFLENAAAALGGAAAGALVARFTIGKPVQKLGALLGGLAAFAEEFPPKEEDDDEEEESEDKEEEFNQSSQVNTENSVRMFMLDAFGSPSLPKTLHSSPWTGCWSDLYSPLQRSGGDQRR